MTRAFFVLCLAACTNELPRADGTLDAPYTAADPGPYGDEAAVHQPTMWGSKTTQARVRVWVEVLDETTGARHPQTPSHFIDQISVFAEEIDEPIFDHGFLVDTTARIVGDVSFKAGTERIHALAHCTTHGWWRRIYERAGLDVPPTGEQQRPFSAGQPGDPDLALSHVPVLVQAGGQLVIEIGDRAADALHETTPDHYVARLVVLNQDSQTLVDTPLGPDGGEPARIVDFAADTGSVRIMAECNTHGWWEAVYVIPG